MDAIGGGPGPDFKDTLSALRDGRISDPRERLKASSKLLEGTFYQELFKVMRQTVPDDGAIPGGSGRDVFEGLFDQQIADAAAMQNEGGLGSALYRYLAQALPPTDSTEG